MDHPTSDPTLTLRDIADLANVKRAVVTTWRKRQQVNGQRIPFPDPVSSIDGVNRYRRADVVEYLDRTGRGNNTEHSVDAPAAGVPDGTDLETLVTLLCLHTLLPDGFADLDPQRCPELARDCDPDDELFAGEVATAVPAAELLEYIEELVSSTFGPADALDRLEASRVARESAARDLNPSASPLLRTIVDTCRTELDHEGAQLVSAGESPELVRALVDDECPITVLGDTPAARALRRRMTIRDLNTPDAAGPRVHLVSVVGADVTETIDRVGESLLEVAPGDIAIVLGSAAALCDSLRGRPEGERAKLLRGGDLVAALRLPRGLWREAHRQALGIWVVRNGFGAKYPVVADLGNTPVTNLDLDGVAADLTSALGDFEARVARVYRYGRPYDLSRILADRAVVPPGVCAVRVRPPESTMELDRVHAASLVTRTEAGVFDVNVASRPGALEVRQWSLGELADRKLIRCRNGSRIKLEHATPDGTVRVLSADGSTDHLALDPLDAQHHYDRAARTDPGDVIFQENPPRARVDEIGGGLVASPARSLRLSEQAGIGPHTLAALINGLPAQRSGWRGWNVPRIGHAESVRLETILLEIAAYESRLSDRVSAARELRSALIEGAGAGTITLGSSRDEVPERVPDAVPEVAR